MGMGYGMQGELVQTTTADGVTLHGLWRAGANGRAVLLVPDLFRAFYSAPYLADLDAALAQRGIGLLAANMRDNQVSSLTSQASIDKQAGGGREAEPTEAAGLFGASRRDIAAWLDLLAARGASRAALVGEGLGATKAADAAMTGDKRVRGVGLLSPPDGAAVQQALGQRLDEALAWALLMLEAGQADELITLDGVGPVSARLMRDLFGMRGAMGRFNYADRGHDWGWLGEVKAPLLAVYREEDNLSQPAERCLDILKRHATGAKQVVTAAVLPHDGPAMAALVGDWVAGL